jgi:hypothetical protein
VSGDPSSSLLLLDQTGVPQSTGGIAVIEVFSRDTKVSRSRATGSRPSHRASERRPISGFSAKSWYAAYDVLRNATGFKSFVTLTFAEPVMDDRRVKHCLDVFGKWLQRDGVDYFWKREFQESGRPHIHLLLSEDVGPDLLRAAWGRACGSPGLIHARSIVSHDALIYYILKDRDAPCNRPPEGYVGLGRYWGRRGKVACPLLTVAGPIESIAVVLRPLKRAANADRCKRGRSSLRDPGYSGMHLHDYGGPNVAEAVRRYAESFPLVE